MCCSVRQQGRPQCCPVFTAALAGNDDMMLIHCHVRADCGDGSFLRGKNRKQATFSAGFGLPCHLSWMTAELSEANYTRDSYNDE